MSVTRYKKDMSDGQSYDQQLQGNQEILRRRHHVEGLTSPPPIINLAHGKSKTIRRSVKKMLEHQLQFLSIGIVALTDYFVAPYLNTLPLVLMQVLFFGLCFACLCDVSTECLKRAAKLNEHLHKDPNLAMVCQIWRKCRSRRHRN